MELMNTHVFQPYWVRSTLNDIMHNGVLRHLHYNFIHHQQRDVKHLSESLLSLANGGVVLQSSDEWQGIHIFWLAKYFLNILKETNGQIKWTVLIDRTVDVVNKRLIDTFEELTHPNVDVLQWRNNGDEYIFGRNYTKLLQPETQYNYRQLYSCNVIKSSLNQYGNGNTSSLVPYTNLGITKYIAASQTRDDCTKCLSILISFGILECDAIGLVSIGSFLTNIRETCNVEPVPNDCENYKGWIMPSNDWDYHTTQLSTVETNLESALNSASTAKALTKPAVLFSNEYKSLVDDLLDDDELEVKSLPDEGACMNLDDDNDYQSDDDSVTSLVSIPDEDVQPPCNVAPGEMLSDETANRMARAPKLESYKYFDEYRMIDERRHIVFKQIPSDVDFSVEVPTSQLIGKLHVAVDGENVTKVCFTDTFKDRGAFLNEILLGEGTATDPGIVPEHLWFAHDKSRCLEPPVVRDTKTYKGAKPKHEYAVIFPGRCRWNTPRQSQYKNKDDCDKCTTTFLAGITWKDVKLFGSNASSHVTIHCHFKGRCIHPKNNSNKWLRGSARENERHKVSQSNNIVIYTTKLYCLILSLCI